MVNVWTWVSLKRGGEWHEFAVGGVMVMGVASKGEGDGAFEYLTVGEWLGAGGCGEIAIIVFDRW